MSFYIFVHIDRQFFSAPVQLAPKRTGVETFNAMHGVKFIPAGGAFYAFPDTRSAIELLAKRVVIRAANDLAFSEHLLEKAGVAVVPGSAFGAEGYIRISFATSMDNLKNSLTRIHEAIS